MHGAADVVPELQNLNQQFFAKASSSTNNNAKVMAYLLDKDIWTNKFIGNDSEDKVDYVIGGPTIEQIVSVHNKKHPSDKISIQSTTTGYQISKGSSGWEPFLSSVLNTSDSELVIKDTTKSSFECVAGPSADGADYVMYVTNNGGLGRGNWTNQYGFRPVVSLKSTAHLEDTGSGYTIN